LKDHYIYKMINHKVAHQLFENCIYKYITSFSLIEQKQCEQVIHGFLLDLKKVNICIHCKTLRTYSEEYDAYYCKKCNYWIETICSDKKCEYCRKRPKYPLYRGRK